VHYLMWLGTAVLFAAGFVAFIWDFAKAGLPKMDVGKPYPPLLAPEGAQDCDASESALPLTPHWPVTQ
jgi:hypothetical protein